MATYKDLLAQKAKLEEQLEAARAAEVETAIAQVRQIVLEYGLTAEDEEAERLCRPAQISGPEVRLDLDWPRPSTGMDCRQEL